MYALAARMGDMEIRSNWRQLEEAEEAAVPAAPPERLDEVLKVVKLELVSASAGLRERGRGFNPYDGRLGRASRDVWGRRRRS
jgi:hypothetical protein